ncbi:MAG: ABC transporter ATP-binding protein [Oscillospiraceae bacterium]|nr:ABC transporter ATP-binding protein [Oscillospiraceae bacterium]
MLSVKKVSKKYDAQQILTDVSFDIQKGEFVSLVGKSGSGKSTLLNIIGGLEKADEGKIIFCGNDISGYSHSQMAKYHNSEIGFVFQSFHLEPNYSVYQNAELPLIISRKKYTSDTVMKLLSFVGLEEKANTKVKYLSGGEKQRACFARALVNDPQLILADEPCGNLDTANGKVIMDLLRAAADSGKAVLLVTHNMDDAKKTDRMIHLSDGRIQLDREQTDVQTCSL